MHLPVRTYAHMRTHAHTHTLVRQNVCSRGSYRCEKAVVPKHVKINKNDELSTVAAVSESQNFRIEMVAWRVCLTDQVRYHQHSSSVFVGARLDGLLAPPALKLKN